MGDFPSFNLLLSCIMFVVPMLVSSTRFNFKKAVFGIMFSLSFLVYVSLEFLLVLTSTILNTYFCPFILSDMDYPYQSPNFFLLMEATLIDLQTSAYPLPLSISKLQPMGGTTTCFCLFVTLGWTTLISPNFNLGWSSLFLPLQVSYHKSTLSNLQTSSINGKMKWWSKSTRRKRNEPSKNKERQPCPW